MNSGVRDVMRAPIGGLTVAGPGYLWSGGGGGIRTHGPRLKGHGLANRRLGPLGHPSGPVSTLSYGASDPLARCASQDLRTITAAFRVSFSCQPVRSRLE